MVSEAASRASALSHYQDSVAGRLRYALARQNIEKMHSLSRPLNVLDAAGGNGVNTEYFLRQGHSVTLFDSDPGMLEQARSRLSRFLEKCQIVEGHLEGIVDLVPDRKFDLVLCHHVVEYLQDGLRIFKSLYELAAPAGELSLITLNPVSEVIRAVIFRQDPALASSRLTDLNYDARWFGQAKLYSAEEVIAAGEDAGWRLRDFRAIRVFSDYFPEKETTAERERELLSLEDKLGALEPYRRIGRYTQFCFEKPGD